MGHQSGLSPTFLLVRLSGGDSRDEAVRLVTQKGDRLVGVCRLLGDGGVGGGVGGGHIYLHPLVPAHARTVEDSMVCRGRSARHRNNIGYIWPARSRTHELQQYKLKYFGLILILPSYKADLPAVDGLAGRQWKPAACL